MTINRRSNSANKALLALLSIAAICLSVFFALQAKNRSAVQPQNPPPPPGASATIPTDFGQPTPAMNAAAYLHKWRREHGYGDESTHISKRPPATSTLWLVGREPLVLVPDYSTFDLLGGNTIISCNKGATITANDTRIEIGRHGIVYASVQKDLVQVKALNDPITVYFTDDNQKQSSAKLKPGDEITIGMSADDGIGRRLSHKLAASATRCEFSIPDLFTVSPQLREMLTNTDKEKANLAQLILKNAAALSVVTDVRHGSYFR